jgi:hypothetical protein
MMLTDVLLHSRTLIEQERVEKAKLSYLVAQN